MEEVKSLPHYPIPSEPLKEINAMSNKLTILVVDADQAFRESVANLLLACGVSKFETASSIEEAKEKISRTFFDIILVDLFMPHMKGLHFARDLLKGIPATKTILLIEDQQLPLLNRAGKAELDFPTVLKSFVSGTLPQLLSDESNSESLRT